MLTELDHVRYWQTREEAFLVGLPVGFAQTGDHVLHILFDHGYLESISRREDPRTIRRLEFKDYRTSFGPPQTFQTTPQGLLAVLYFKSESELSERYRPYITPHSADGQLSHSVELAIQKRMRASSSFAFTIDEQIIFSNVGEIYDEVKGRTDTERHPLALYDKNGTFIRSFGPAKPTHPGVGVEPLLLVSDKNGDCFCFYRWNYRFLRLDASGECITDRTIDLPFQIPQPMGTHFSLIKDVAVGSAFIVVLLARDTHECHTPVGTRIDVVSGDGKSIQTHYLNYPAAFVLIDDAGTIWCLHTLPPNCLIGESSEYPYLIQYGLSEKK